MSVEFEQTLFHGENNITSKLLLKKAKNIPGYFLSWVTLLAFIIIFTDIAAAGNSYTIHCASYKTSKQAASDVNSMQAAGYPAFFVRVNLKEKGKWYRVYTGKYVTREKARLAAEEMVKKKVLSEYFIFPLSASQAIQDKGKNTGEAHSLKDKPAAVIANRDSKRYHLSGMPFYGKVKKSHRVVFNSEKEAIAAGYYKAGERNIRRVEEKQASVPATDNYRGKSGLAQGKVKQDKQSIQATAKKGSVAAGAKTVEKIQQTPPALVFEKKSGKDKNNEHVFEEKEESNSGSVLYDKALGELKGKKYDQALVTFKEFVARQDTTKDLGERALRHMADCHFFLGEKGSKDHLLLAVQFYKNTLYSFPDQARDNALTYLRLARSYEYLGNYSDALKDYENLLGKYPQSVYAAEASFKIGALLHKTGKYRQAVDKLIAYLMKYRGGYFAKQAFYLAADCHYKMQQSASAEVWFRDAQKKWPDYKGIPKEVIMDMGQHKYAMRSYGEAIKIFSLYANLYPNNEKLKEVLLLLANSYMAADQVSAALTIYNLILDKYPESKEAQESIMCMAFLGIDHPGAKIFSALENFRYYKNPLAAYDQLLRKNTTGEIAESALLRKGDALHKLKQDGKAVVTYSEFLKRYPQSKMAGEARKSLKLASIALIDESFRKKDYLAVSDIYFKAYRMVPLQSEEYETVDKIAVSLNNVGLPDEYVGLLKSYKNVCKDDKNTGNIMLRIAEAEMAAGKYDESEKNLKELMIRTSIKNKALMAAIKKDMAEIADRKQSSEAALSQLSNPGLKYWSLFQTGQDYLKKDNNAEAQRTFNKIKTESGPEGFWTKIVDYYVNDREWWDKYGEYLKK